MARHLSSAKTRHAISNRISNAMPPYLALPDVPIPSIGFAQFFLIFQAGFWLLTMLLPREMVLSDFKMAFPFLPEKLN
jgi:hypothetical protein